VIKELVGQENLNGSSEPLGHLSFGFNVRNKEIGAAYSEC
jgi:hypothetical protein